VKGPEIVRTQPGLGAPFQGLAGEYQMIRELVLKRLVVPLAI
jgi:hypothetical protein